MFTLIKIFLKGVNYDPMNPMGDSMDATENKDAKAALRATSLVTKYVCTCPHLKSSFNCSAWQDP
jgi:hypothetical protein